MVMKLSHKTPQIYKFQKNIGQLDMVRPTNDFYFTKTLDDNELNENNRILVFSDLMLNELERNDVWMLEGTFKVSPSLFVQQHTIHVVIGGHSGHVFPCVYALLPDKSTETYKILLYSS